MIYESIMDQINVVNPQRKTSNFRGLETTNSWRIDGWFIVVGFTGSDTSQTKHCL